jgi:hypothetical protein
MQSLSTRQFPLSTNRGGKRKKPGARDRAQLATDDSSGATRTPASEGERNRDR